MVLGLYNCRWKKYRLLFTTKQFKAIVDYARYRRVIVDRSSATVKSTLFRDEGRKPEQNICSYQGKNETEKPLLAL